MEGDAHLAIVGDYVTLVRGTTYKGTLVGEPGPALLGLGSIEPGGGFRIGNYQTYGGDCPGELMLFPGDIYASLKGATKDGKMIGSVARVPPSVPTGRLTQDTVKLVFRSTDPVAQTYLYWVLRTPQYREYCAGHAMGSAVVALSRRDFLSYPVPPLTTPRRMLITLLDAIEGKIELYRRINETLVTICRDVFEAWFGDAASAGSGQGSKAVTVGDVAEVNARTLSAADHLENIHYIEISGVSRGEVLEVTEYARGAEPSRARRRLRHGDTVMSTVRPERGAYFLSLWPNDSFVVSTGFAVLTPTRVPWSFLHVAMTQASVFAGLGHLADGGAYPAIRPDVIQSWPIPCPQNGRLLEEFHAVAGPLLERAERNRRESRTLVQVRDALLPKLLSGEIRMQDAQGLQVVAP
jgi:type I restriction enzyme S subunit